MAETGASVQVIWVVRHGDRMDSFDSSWKKTAKHRGDTPLSPTGHIQAEEVAKWILKTEKVPPKHILASPFLRTIQTATPLSKMMNLPIKLEKSVWETGCRNPPPPHDQEGFPLDTTGYESGFEPTCGERPTDFRPRLARAAEIIRKRFPVEEGNVIVFSHADPVAYLVSELCGMDPTLTGPVIPCSIFRLERRPGDELFKCVHNSGVQHLSIIGRTEPCHPIHFFHDWCRLFEEMRQNNLVPETFRWPPQEGHEMDAFKKSWTERYTKLLVEGKTDTFPVIGPPRQSRRKVQFECLKCGVVSYVRKSMFKTAPPHHVINCWKCKGRFLLHDIPLPPETKDAKDINGKIKL